MKYVQHNLGVISTCHLNYQIIATTLNTAGFEPQKDTTAALQKPLKMRAYVVAGADLRHDSLIIDEQVLTGLTTFKQGMFSQMLLGAIYKFCNVNILLLLCQFTGGEVKNVTQGRKGVKILQNCFK